MASSAVQRFNDLIKAESGLKEPEVAEVFNALPPVSLDTLIGKWKGGGFDTGHSAHKRLSDYKWAGKDFHSVNEVDPIMVLDDQGNRNWLPDFGHARLREVKFRGVVSAAMIYDNFPIIDTFRYVSEGVVMGAMDNKGTENEGTYYFYLTKLE